MKAPTDIDNDFLLENTIWKVELSNNEIYISDHQVIDDKSDWQRLKEYCNTNNLYVINMWICFRDQTRKIPNGKYYFFRRMTLAPFGEIERKDKAYQHFVVGSTDNKNNIHLIKYLVPELTIGEEEDRILEDSEPSLI